MYVVNILLVGTVSVEDCTNQVDLGKQFQLKDMGKLHGFLGVSKCTATLQRDLDWPTSIYPSYYQEISNGAL